MAALSGAEGGSGLLIIHAAATLYMAGVGWYVQVVHYPLFARVGPAQFPGYQQANLRLTALVIVPPMVVEAATGAYLLFTPPAGAPPWLLRFGAVLLMIIWASTALVQVPLHLCLAQRFERGLYSRLLRANWVRTLGWSLRGIVVILLLALTR